MRPLTGCGGQRPAPSWGRGQRRASESPVATWRALCEAPRWPRLTKHPLPPAGAGREPPSGSQPGQATLAFKLCPHLDRATPHPRLLAPPPLVSGPLKCWPKAQEVRPVAAATAASGRGPSRRKTETPPGARHGSTWAPGQSHETEGQTADRRLASPDELSPRHEE